MELNRLLDIPVTLSKDNVTKATDNCGRIKRLTANLCDVEGLSNTRMLRRLHILNLLHDLISQLLEDVKRLQILRHMLGT